MSHISLEDSMTEKPLRICKLHMNISDLNIRLFYVSSFHRNLNAVKSSQIVRCAFVELYASNDCALQHVSLVMEAQIVSRMLEEDFIALESLFVNIYFGELICKFRCFHSNIDHL